MTGKNAKIRAAMNLAEISQKDLAEGYGCTAAWIGKLLRHQLEPETEIKVAVVMSATIHAKERKLMAAKDCLKEV